LVDGALAWIWLFFVGPPLLLYLRRVRHLAFGHLFAVALFITYLAGVAAFALFPFRLDAEYVSRPPFDPPIVLDLFFLGRPEAMSPAQYLGNVLLGIPFGFLVPFVWRLSLPKVLVAGLGFSLLIEAIQWLSTKLMIAFPSRAVDINDVFLNTLGALIGILGFAVVRALYRVLFARVGSTPRAWEHFHATLMARGD
jgi:glycopeptide antibiotics resistance protein